MGTRSGDDRIISKRLSADWTFLLFDSGVLPFSLFLLDERFRMFE